jgi:hypothetical protein
MKIFFVTKALTDLAEEKTLVIDEIKKALLRKDWIEETNDPNEADALIIQEKWSYKDFRYLKRIEDDPFISKYISKVFTLNSDDCATGIFRGLYICITKSKLDNKLHASVPFLDYFNQTPFEKEFLLPEPKYLASWRGNPMSNKVRPKMIKLFGSNSEFCIESTDTWLNHSNDEKENYINLILNSKFSLCPGGWAPSSIRIFESMALGRCPVIIADEFSPPKGPAWHEFALFFPEKDIKNLPRFLHEHESSFKELGLKAKEAWHTFFDKEHIADYYANSLLQIIRSTTHLTYASEINRWKSFHFYKINGWTLSQRIIIKIKNFLPFF